jgi:hypothetical protein
MKITIEQALKELKSYDLDDENFKPNEEMAKKVLDSFEDSLPDLFYEHVKDFIMDGCYEEDN